MARAKRKNAGRARSDRARPSDANNGETADKGQAIQEAILKRLNGLIYLLAERIVSEPPKESEETEAGDKGKSKARKRPPAKQEQLSILLTKGGLRPIEIADLTGRADSNVNRDLSRARKDGRLSRASR
jgi:DNA-directed RNA polymerase specialized sigma24 family protein